MAVEMDQQLRSRDLEKGTGPIFSSHMVAHIWSQGSTPASGLCRYQACTWCTDIHASQISIHIK